VTDTIRRQAEDLFQEAVNLPATERAAFLDERGVTDPALRAEVESLLVCLDDAQISSLAAVDEAADPEFVGRRIGPYTILELIGEGGFGAVYLAEQHEPIQRRVALKVIKLGMDTKEVIARFEAERQALAMMDHPNIARVLDAGATDTGRPSFVMELVRGVPVTDYCDEHGLTVRERLALFIPVCHAVQHAHQKGIIHRDLKPSNVLVTEHDGAPVPKVIDFGIAKAMDRRLTERTYHTQSSQFIGTPEYMSPEQAELGGLDVDTRTDIYSLGVILYELLTGRPPFDREAFKSATFGEIQRIIREESPPPPSSRLGRLGPKLDEVARSRRVAAASLRRMLRGDLDWIVMKAVEKDRARRYETAAAFAADVERHLRNEPVQAGPPGVMYRFGKFVRRHRVGVAAGCAIAVALLAGLALATIGLVQAGRARDAFEKQRDDAEAARKSEAEQRERAELAAEQAKDAADKAKKVSHFLRYLLESVEPGEVSPKDRAIRHMLEVAERHLAAGELDGQPVVEADIRATLGRLYSILGVYPQARAHLEKSAAVLERIQGPWSSLTARSKLWLSGVYERQGLDARAEKLLRDVVEANRRLYGEEHLWTVASMSYLAFSIWRQGRYKEGEALHRKAARILRRNFGEDHIQTIHALTGLAGAILRQGRESEAIAIFRRVLELRERVHGADSIEAMSVWANLAPLIARQGQVDEAERQIRKVLEAYRRVHGDSYFDTLNAQYALGIILARKGKLEEADATLRDCIERQNRVLGMHHGRTNEAFKQRIRVLRRLGDPEAIRSAVDDRFADFEDAAEHPDVDPETLRAYARFILDYPWANRCDPATAVSVARRAVKKSAGRDAKILYTLAYALHQSGDLAGAVEAMRKAIAVDSPDRTGVLTPFERRLVAWQWQRLGAVGAWQAFVDILFARHPSRDRTGSNPDR